MAIENAKLFNVRIKNKYDSYENWAKSSIVLEAGEIAIAHTTVSVNENGVNVEHPALLMKVGDGVKTFSQLPWMSAKAADVVSACKSTEALTTFVKDVINSAGIATTEGLAQLANKVETAESAIDALEALVGDTSVQAQIEAAIESLDLDNVYDAKGAAQAVQDNLDAYEIANNAKVNANTDAIAAINNADTGILAQAKAHTNTEVAADRERLNALEAKFTGDGSVADQIANAVAAEAEARDKAIEDAVKAEADRAKATEEANAAAIKAVSDDYLKAADKKELQDQITTNANAIELLTNGVSADEVDGVNDLIQYVKDHGAEVTGMKEDISNNAAAIKALQEANAEGGAVANAIAEAKQAGEDATAAVEALEAGAVADNAAAIAQEKTDREAAIAQEVSDRNAAITTAKQEAAEDATTKANDAKDAAIAAAATDAQTKADAAQAAAEATAAADATTKADAALADAKTHVAEEIAKLDSSVTVSSNKHVLTGITEVDGKLTEKTEVELANVAFTGSTDDLVQGTMTLVFDCGTSAA